MIILYSSALILDGNYLDAAKMLQLFSADFKTKINKKDNIIYAQTLREKDYKKFAES